MSEQSSNSKKDLKMDKVVNDVKVNRVINDFFIDLEAYEQWESNCDIGEALREFWDIQKREREENDT